jgi:pimeloyl-ACP methyl ester carboxylesterase
MDALGLARADIVAHSHGGAVALMLAARHPRRVSRLILFAPANPYSNASDTMVRLYSTPWGAFALRMLPYLPAAIQRRALGDMYGGPQNVVDASLRELSQGLRQPGTLRHVLAIVRSWFVEMHRLRRALHRIGRIPTLLVWGDRDFTVSLRSGMRLHRKLRGSKLVVIPGGHSVFEESPDAVNRIVTDWLGQTSSAGPRRSALAARTRQRAALRAVAAKPSAAASLHRLPSES